jgi:hypothetical protein
MLSAEDFEKVLSGEYSSESYRVLSVLIPELPKAIPLYEWEGYADQEAMDNDQYEEEADRSPTTAEIVDAFETAIMVSGADRLGKIVNLVQMGVEGQAAMSAATPSSPDSPGSNGESD